MNQIDLTRFLLARYRIDKKAFNFDRQAVIEPATRMNCGRAFHNLEPNYCAVLRS